MTMVTKLRAEIEKAWLCHSVGIKRVRAGIVESEMNYGSIQNFFQKVNAL